MDSNSVGNTIDAGSMIQVGGDGELKCGDRDGQGWGVGIGIGIGMKIWVGCDWGW